MGVVYRLTPQISAFIISEKQRDPKATCQHLSGLVFLQFGCQVSKSSVHALLKQQKIITPRVRRIKDTFKIPVDKKKEISASLAPFAATLGEVSLPSTVTEGRIDQETEHRALIANAGELLITAVLGDLSFKPALGITGLADAARFKEEDKGQWSYLTQEVSGIRVKTRRGAFFLDARLQGVYADHPCQASLSVPIERAIAEATDKILNNIEPLIIRGYGLGDLNQVFYHLAESFENRQENAIESISLLDAKAREYTCFNAPPAFKRFFMIGVSADHPEMQWAIQDERHELPWPDSALSLKLIKKDGLIIITNAMSMTGDGIIEAYQARHPIGGYQGYIPPKEGLSHPKDSAAWIRERLMQRAQGFFTGQAAQESVERFIRLSGYEETDGKTRRILLQASGNSADKDIFIKTCQLINSMDIKDTEQRKLLFIIE